MGGVTSIAEARSLKKLDASETHIERLLADARLKLVETGARNRLIHTPRGAKRTRCLPLIGAKPDPVFVNLVREGKQLRFLPAASRPDREAAARGGHPGRNGLQTLLAPEALQKRLHAIYRDGKTAEEERGVNILFLALGFLRWYEDERSDALREAPLILLPITLVRDAKRSTFDLAFRDDDIVSNQALQERLRGDFAISLPDVLDAENWLPSGYFSAVATAISSKRRWSIDADAVELGFFSSSKLLIVRDLDPANWPHNSLSGHPLVRGLLRDGFASEPPLLPEDARLDEILAPQDLVQIVDADSSQTRVIESVRAGRNLIVQGPPGTGKSQTITNIIAAAAHDGKTVLFVSEKMAALNVVFDRLKSAGLGDLCLELHSHTANKRLVADRLDQTLQSAAGRDFEDLETADELAAVRGALNHVAARLHVPVGDTGMTARQALGVQMAANVRQVTPDAALVKIAARWTKEDYEAKAKSVERLAKLTAVAGPLNRHIYFGVRRSALQPTDFQRLAPQMKRLAQEAGALAATASGVARFLGLQHSPTLAGVTGLIGLLRVIASLPPEGLAIARAICEPTARDRVIEAAKKGLDWRRRHIHYAGAFDGGIWRAPLARLRPTLARGASFWPARYSKAYRDSERLIRGHATAPLPKGPAARLALVDELIRGQELSRALDVESYFLRDILGGLWRGGETDFALLHQTALTLKELALFDADLNFDRVIELARKGVAGLFADDFEASLNGLKPLAAATLQALDVDLAAVFRTKTMGAIDLERLAERASLWAIHPGRFEEWARLAKADRQMRAIGPPSFADALASGALAPTRAPAMIEAAFAEATWRRAIAADPELAAFDGDRHNALIAIFRTLEERRRHAVAIGVRARHQAGLPRGALGAMGVVRGEIGRKRNHMPLRKLMKTAGETVQKIKPVFLMSPLSVAQYLPPGALEFDLLVIDEASQVRPGDALGVVARCRQMVIVGDKKQLPPTQFFDRMLADDVDSTDEDEAIGPGGASFAPVSDLESILSLCEARGVESQMLRWHYRSRHPSLIQVSNAEFYHRLVMPPAPTSERGEKGLIMRRVSGSYDRGGLRTNLAEAEAIAAACAEHARAHPELSLGVITFSTAQRDLIGDCLDARRRSDPLLDAFLRERGREDAFVKNLENVQGDERDVILISVGYGPREPGKPLDRMAFGPISSEGGERRLNVLFTRARARCEIFVSFGSGDINLERATGAGPRVLKRFLQFAETGVLEEAKATGGDFESPFEANVAAAIESMGFTVESQVGSVGFRIDLAVRDPARPGRFILGVECDGATYHSALWARERDRLRQEVLEGLGWRVHRIWSTDWFYRRDEQLRKLKTALEAARGEARSAPAAALGGQSAKLAPPRRGASKARPKERAAAAFGTRHSASRAAALPPAYVMASGDAFAGDSIDALDASRLAAIARSVIEQEGPIRQDEIMRRVSSFFGRGRLGGRAAQNLAAAFDLLKTKAEELRRDGEFWLTANQKRAPPVRCRAGAPARLQKLAMIAPVEIKAAIKLAGARARENGEGDLAAAVAALLGLPKRPARAREQTPVSAAD